MLSCGNWMSMTARMRWTILRSLVWFVLMGSVPGGVLDSGCAADDFRQFLGDGRLARLVVDEGEIVDDAGGVVARRLHRDHARRLLARDVLGHGLVDDLLHVACEKLLEHHPSLGLVEIVPVRPRGRLVVAEAIERQWHQLLDPRLPLPRVYETRVDDVERADLAFGESVDLDL